MPRKKRIATKPVTLESTNPLWPTMFEQEAARIQKALGTNCITIHHVGSTAVPGLAAKPIIDMIPVVRDITQVDLANSAMQSLGYDVKGEAGMLFRRFFTKKTPDLNCNIHIYEPDAGEVDRLLRFRDWMRTHPDDLKAYATLKQQLAIQYPQDLTAYCLAKDAFVAQIDSKTGYDGFRCVLALTTREWEAYHRIRDELMFRPSGIIYDRNHPSITAENNAHIVLYKGSQIVSVAQVEWMNEQQAALRSLATDTPFQKRGYGAYLLKSLERWIRQQGRNQILLHAVPTAEHFYRQLGYHDIVFDDPCRIPVYIDLGKTL